MSNENSYRHIWNVSYPILLGGVAATVNNITDTAFLGHISEVALGASAIAGLFYVTLLMLGWGFGVGSQIIIARLDGEKNTQNIGGIVDHSFYFLMALALLIYIFLIYFSPFILQNFVSSKEILSSSLLFIKHRSWGIFFGFGLIVLRSYFVGISDSKVVIYTTVISAVSNILLNYLLVFGNMGFPAMGIAGSASASSISDVLALLFAVWYTVKFAKIKEHKLFQFRNFDYSIFKEVFVTAAPIMFQTFMAVCSWFVFFMIVEQMGEHPLAISNLIRNMYMILMIPLIGFSSATNTLVSNIIGQGKKQEVFSMVKKIMLLSIIATSIPMAINLINPRLTLSIFTSDQNLIDHTLPTLYVICGSLMMFSFTSILLSAVSGSGDTMASLVIEFITISFYLFASYVVAIYWKKNIEIVWCVEYVYFAFLGLLSYLYLRRKLWV